MAGIRGSQLRNATITATQLATSVAGNGLTGGAGTALSVVVDSSTLEILSNALQIKDLGVTNAKLAGSISDDKLLEQYIKADGTRAFSGNQSMGGYKLTNVADGAVDSDAVNYGQLNAIATAGKAWKETVLHANQMVDGASGGIKAANVLTLSSNLSTGDTITLTDGTTTESYIAGTDFSIGATINDTLANLSSAINNGALADSVVTSNLGSIDSTNNVMVIVEASLGSGLRIYGDAGAATVAKILPTSALYTGTSSDLAALPSSDPESTNFGFSRAVASLAVNETHYERESDASYTWDSDASVWNLTGASSIPFASKSVFGKVQISDGIAVASGVISIDVSSSGGLVLSGTSPNKQLVVNVDGATLAIVSNAVKIADGGVGATQLADDIDCLLYTSPSPRDLSTARMPSSA